MVSAFVNEAIKEYLYDVNDRYVLFSADIDIYRIHFIGTA